MLLVMFPSVMPSITRTREPRAGSGAIKAGIIEPIVPADS